MRRTWTIVLLTQGALSLPVAERRSGRAAVLRGDVPYHEAAYDPLAAEDFYRKRPVESAARLAKIVTRSLGFVADTAMDSRLGREDEMADRRGDELLELVSDLGVSRDTITTQGVGSDVPCAHSFQPLDLSVIRGALGTGSQPSSKVRYWRFCKANSRGLAHAKCK